MQGRAKFIYFSLVGMIALAWFLTPLPSWIALTMVHQIPVSEDIAIGNAARQHTHYNIVNDNGQLHSMGMKLISALAEQSPSVNKYDWRFQLINEPFVNAFAYPGGNIFVTKELWEMATKDEVSAILGHEIGHVLHRHSQQRVIQQKLASLVIKLLFWGDGNGHQESMGKELGGLLAQNAEMFSRLSYSRSNEFEADAVAFWASLSSHANPEAAVTFFKKLDGGDKGTSWYSTHPGSKDRITKLEEKQQQLLKEKAKRSSRQNGDRGGDVKIAQMFKPSGVVDVSSDSVGFGSVGFGMMWSAWNLLPQQVQVMSMMEAISTAAISLDAFIDMMSESNSQQQRHREERPEDVHVCEDGESKVSFEPVRPGYFVHLGHGYCLSSQDLRAMASSSIGVNTNPYTQQPFTDRQKQQIGKLLRGERL